MKYTTIIIFILLSSFYLLNGQEQPVENVEVLIREAQIQLNRPSSPEKKKSFQKLARAIQKIPDQESQFELLILMAQYYRNQKQPFRAHAYFLKAYKIASDDLKDPRHSPIQSYLLYSYDQIIPRGMYLLWWLAALAILCYLITGIDVKQMTLKKAGFPLLVVLVNVVLALLLMLVFELTGVPPHPEEIANDTHFYSFIFFNGLRNPIFWTLIGFQSLLIYLIILVVMLQKVRRHFAFSTILFSLISLVMLALISIGFKGVALYNRLPAYFSPLYQGFISSHILLLIVLAIIIVPQFVYWFIKKSFSGPGKAVICAVYLVLVAWGGLFHFHRGAIRHSHPLSLYFKADIESEIFKNPKEFVNPNLNHSADEKLNQRLKKEAVFVPEREFNKKRQDDVWP